MMGVSSLLAIMDLLKTPSVLSLLDSDLESVDSLQCLDIEELDEVEYALTASEAPTLAEVLSAEDDGEPVPDSISKPEPTVDESLCSALQVEFLQGISQQLTQAQERSSAGAATALSIADGSKLTVGTAHGHLLSFQDQILRWVCNTNTSSGAVSCLDYNQAGDRLLVGFARGLICQYETSKGLVLRRVTLGGSTWGVLRAAWAGAAGLALDTGGSVWLLKFSRPLGVRSARASCLFSGARGEVVCMAARDARVLALATLSRVLVVAGGRAAGVRLGGAPHTMPSLAWCESDDRLLVCAREYTLQWLSVEVSGAAVSLRPVRRFTLQSVPLWLGWLDGSLAILDAAETLRLWGDDDSTVDLTQIEPVYASAFFKGVWTDGRVSAALRACAGGALGGACARSGLGAVLGRRGVARVRVRARTKRARALINAGRAGAALRLLHAAPADATRATLPDFLAQFAERPSLLAEKTVADQLVKLCVKLDASESLWSVLWERCSTQHSFVEALGLAAVRGELATWPSPECTQALLETLADIEPQLVERVLASLPLTSLDPHRASVFARGRGLWRAVGAVAAALGGSAGAIRELTAHVSPECARDACACAGDALLLAAADGLAGRGAGGRDMPDHARPSARHDALQTLLTESGSGRPPLCALVRHDARSTVRLLEQSWREPPFVGPLGKQNRLRVVRALLAYSEDMQDSEQCVEVAEFVAAQVSAGALPADAALAAAAAALAARGRGERADRALVALAPAAPAAADPARPRVAWRLAAQRGESDAALEQFFRIAAPSETDLDELFDFLREKFKTEEEAAPLRPHLARLVELRAAAAAALLRQLPGAAAAALEAARGPAGLACAESLLEAGALRGAAAAAHLRNLCRARPARVEEFLRAQPGLVRPEEALRTVRELGPRAAEPAALEAAGELPAALDALLALADEAGEGGEAERLVAAAARVCERADREAPQQLATEMWTRLVSRAGAALPPAALLAASRRVPAARLGGAAAGAGASGARRVLALAAGEARAWAAAARLLRRELAARGAGWRRAAGRGARAGAQCGACGRALAARPPVLVRCGAAGGAVHAACAAGQAGAARSLPAPRAPPRRPPPPAPLVLQLVAPPRPDLEGVV